MTPQEKKERTEALKDTVLEDIRKKILLGYRDSEFCNRLAKKYEIAHKTIKDWTCEMREQLAAVSEDWEQHRKVNLTLAEDRLLRLYREALKTKNIKTALEILKELNKVQGITGSGVNINLGLFGKDSIAGVLGGGFSGLSNQEIKKRIESMETYDPTLSPDDVIDAVFEKKEEE